MCVFAAARAEPLPALGAEPGRLTVSGLSSGAYMAVQVHVAHSSRVSGAAAVAGGPYYCAQASVWAAYYNCMTPGAWTPLPSLAALRTGVDALAKAGRIDAASHVAGSRVWLFSGSEDRTVTRPVVDALQQFYASLKANTVLVGDRAAGHAMVTESSGNACGVTEPPYINDCDYDAAGELLAHLLGPLAPASTAQGRLLRFDQRPFAKDAWMADEGFVYVPKSCESSQCRIHVAFHGCRQAGEPFPRDAGYNRWAESNRLIVLYPQVAPSWNWQAFNPRGCWDWWGYTGSEYHTRNGPQVRAVISMVDRLAAR